MPAARPSRPVPGFRALRPACLAWLVSGALLLAACQPASEPGPGQPAGPMYRCLGEAGYSQESWDELLADLEKHPPDCGSRETADETLVPSGIAVSLESHPRPPGDTVRIHGYMLDSQCRFLWDFRDTVALPQDGRPPQAFILRVTEDPAGKPLPTGEYFLNAEFEFADGSKDTTYQKYGTIRDLCAP